MYPFISSFYNQLSFRCNLQGANGKIALGKMKLFSTVLGKLFNMR